MAAPLGAAELAQAILQDAEDAQAGIETVLDTAWSKKLATDQALEAQYGGQQSSAG